jgi:fluoride ion exporter CrcB/FEX
LAVIVLLAGVVSLAVIGGIGGAGTITQDHIISCALGPIGSLTRWTLAMTLNTRFASGGTKFRSGTFLSNAIAVAVAGALLCYAKDSLWTTYIVTGVCGSLSTVSSWVADTMSIHRGPSSWGWAYAYCVVSVLFCTVIMIPFNQ